MKFNRYFIELAKFVLSSSLALGFLLAIVVLVTGGAEGSATIDIDISASDGIWILLGTPFLLTAASLLVSPLSYCIHRFVLRKSAGDSRQ